jgi:Bardet-Biedl syndrome 7 protein
MTTDLRVHRQDLFQVGSVAKGTLAVLPVGKKKQQKVAVGDDNGIITVFYVKKGQSEVEWKSSALGREISRLVLQNGKDKIYAACGQQIRGFTRKGKDFLKIKTNLSETIQSLFVDETTIWTSGEYILNIYEGISTTVKDAGFVMCPDKVHDLMCAPIAPTARLSSIVGCHDRTVRIYADEKLYHELATDGPVTSLALTAGKSVDVTTLAGAPVGILCGMDNGNVSTLRGDQNRLQVAQSLVPSKRRAGVTTVAAADITMTGVADWLVTREDGNIEFWAVAAGFGQEQDPTILYETNVNEAIRSSDAGYVSSGEFQSMVVCTYSGKVLGLSVDPACRDATGAKLATQDEEAGDLTYKEKMMKVMQRAPKTDAKKDAEEKTTKAKRFASMEKEVAELKKKLYETKGKYENTNRQGIAVAAPCKVNHQFKLLAEESCYLLSFQCEYNLDIIAIRGDVQVDILDHGTTGVVFSQTPDPTNQLLVNYQFQEPQTRHEIRLRTVEGKGGSLSCFVVPQISPKTAILVKPDIKPLSLHEKVQKCPWQGKDEPPMNELRLSGSFTMADMNQWLSICVVEVPKRIGETTETELYYKNTFTNSCLHCRYSKGAATFRSDCISTIAVIKDLVSMQATERKIHLNMSCDVNNDSFPWFLENLHIKLAYQTALATKVNLVEPLKEIQLQEGDISYLHHDLKQVLDEHQDIIKKFEEQPQRLGYLYAVVKELYRAKWKLKGFANVEHRMPELEEVLHKYNLEDLLNFVAKHPNDG